MIPFNKLFAFFLSKRGVPTKFKKTEYGYKTYDNKWQLFTEKMSIVHLKPVKVFNGYDYDSGLEETKYAIIEKQSSIDVILLYVKTI